MDEELRAKTLDFAATDERIIKVAPEWIKRLYVWAKEEARKELKKV